MDVDVAIPARYLLVATGKITKLLPFFCQGLKFGGINGILIGYDFVGRKETNKKYKPTQIGIVL